MAASEELSPLLILADPLSDRTLVREAYTSLLRQPDLAVRLDELGSAILAEGETLSAAECRARLHTFVEAELDGRDVGAEFPLVAALIERDPLRAEEYRILVEGLRGLRAGSLPEPDEYPAFDVAFVRNRSAAVGRTDLGRVVPVGLATFLKRVAALVPLSARLDGRLDRDKDGSASDPGPSWGSGVGRPGAPWGPLTPRRRVLTELLFPLSALAILALLLFNALRSTTPISVNDARATAQAEAMATEWAEREDRDSDLDIRLGGTPLGPPGPAQGITDATSSPSPSARPTSSFALRTATPTSTPRADHGGAGGGSGAGRRATGIAPPAHLATPFPTLEPYPGPYPGPEEPIIPIPTVAAPAPTTTSMPTPSTVPSEPPTASPGVPPTVAPSATPDVE